MKILLDTHTLVWFLEGSTELSSKARKLIENIDNTRFISIASIWEIAIKLSVGKLHLKYSFDKLSKLLWDNSIEILPVRFEHTQKIITLPFHHKDPFDRLIIAQALVENLQIIGRDEQFDNHLNNTIKRIW